MDETPRRVAPEAFSEGTQRYQHAQTVLQGLRTQSLVQNDNIEPHWIDAGTSFWYLRHLKNGKQWRLVDTQALSNDLAFDHSALAQALATAAGEAVSPEALPIDILKLSLSSRRIDFAAFDRLWQFDEHTQGCRELSQPYAPNATFVQTQLEEIPSPNGALIAFTRDHNLWLREVATGDEHALTHDGEAFNTYAATSSASGVTGDMIELRWSPDSRRLFTLQRDSREVKTWPMVDHRPDKGKLRPSTQAIKLAFAEDEQVERHRLLTIDVLTGERCPVDTAPIVVGIDTLGFFLSRRAWWAADSRHAYFVAYDGKSYQQLQVMAVDTETGQTRVILTETAPTYVNFKPEYMDAAQYRYLAETNELIWWSQRSGCGQLYLYDLGSGELKHPITQTESLSEPLAESYQGWQVRNILHVDAQRRELLIQTAGRVPGRNPYYRDICRVHIDTGEFTTVLSTDDEYGVHTVFDVNKMFDVAETHDNGVSPNGEVIVATRSRVDRVPVTLVLNRAGDTIMELETANIAHLPAGWQWPVPVAMDAAGPDAQGHKTTIYGSLFLPADYSADQQYPVINCVVSGPWLCAVPHGSFHTSRGYAERYFFQAAALAQLGFMVVVIDSRGTPLRHKAFEESSYGWIPAATDIDDHRQGIEQLAQRYPAMDLTRVGLYCITGYPGGLQSLLGSDNFYSVGVVNTCMDTRLMSRTGEYVDKHHGLDGPSKDQRYPEQLAENWQGRLLLIQILAGWASAAYPAGGSLRLVDALQAANKDLDLIVRSNDRASWGLSPYEQRRTWDYFVKHLHGVEPPREFKLGAIEH